MTSRIEINLYWLTTSIQTQLDIFDMKKVTLLFFFFVLFFAIKPISLARVQSLRTVVKILLILYLKSCQVSSLKKYVIQNSRSCYQR